MQALTTIAEWISNTVAITLLGMVAIPVAVWLLSYVPIVRNRIDIVAMLLTLGFFFYIYSQ